MSFSMKVRTCDDGYTVVIVNGSVDYQGHGKVPEFYWVELLKGMGFQIDLKHISDKNMEEGNYDEDEDWNDD